MLGESAGYIKPQSAGFKFCFDQFGGNLVFPGRASPGKIQRNFLKCSYYFSLMGRYRGNGCCVAGIECDSVSAVNMTANYPSPDIYFGRVNGGIFYTGSLAFQIGIKDIAFLNVILAEGNGVGVRKIVQRIKRYSICCLAWQKHQRCADDYGAGRHAAQSIN